MSKKKEPENISIGLWIPAHRVIDYQGKGYVISEPQPSLDDNKKKFHGDSVHMVKRSA